MDIVAITSADCTTISSLEIAEMTGKRHADVMRDIRDMLEKLGEKDQRSFASIYKDTYGREQDCFSLPKRESYCLAAGYDVKLRMKIIDRWAELESAAPKIPKTLKEALLLAADLEDQKEKALLALSKAETDKAVAEVAKAEADKAVAAAAPKVSAWDRFLNQEGFITWQQASLALGLKANRLTEILRVKGFLTDKLVPTSKLHNKVWMGQAILKAVPRDDSNGRTRIHFYLTKAGMLMVDQLLSKVGEPRKPYPEPDLPTEFIFQE